MTQGDVVLAAPPAAASTVTLLGYPVADWVLWLNLIYIVGLIAWKLQHVLKESRNGSK